MPKYLVIVESPAKAKQSKVPGQELRSDRVQRACSRFAKEYLRIDIENDFEPKYITIRGKN